MKIKDLKRLANWKKKENWCPKHGINLHLGQLEDGKRIWFCPAIGGCTTIRFIKRRKVKMKNCSKVKARDIIPNWPRGRSTTVSYYNDIEGRLICFRYGFGFRMNWAVRMQLIDELKKELAYHQQQQKMVDEFRRNWGTLDTYRFQVIESISGKKAYWLVSK